MIFPQNIIALVWDFDKTLIPGYMEEPIFRHFNADEQKFWREVEWLPDFYRKNGLDLVSKDTPYLNHIITYVRAGIFKGLNNALLRRLGAELDFYPGLPEFFASVKRVAESEEYKKYDIKIEHYIVSTGLRQMILGSKIAPHVDGVWGCEFVEVIAPPGYLEVNNQSSNVDSQDREICDIGYVLDNTTKTRAIFEINKGTNIVPDIDVNAAIKEEDRRVPVANMIYIADGPSDVPVFSIVNKGGGRTFAVYPRGAAREFAQANNLQKQGRVQSVGEADYTEGSKIYLWIMQSVREIADRIVRNRDRAISEKVSSPPRHLSSG